MRTLPIYAFLLLSACATPEQMAMQQQMQEQTDIDTCASYGLKPGSEAFGMCRLELDMERQRQSYGHQHPYPHAYGGYFPHRYGADFGY